MWAILIKDGDNQKKILNSKFDKDLKSVPKKYKCSPELIHENYADDLMINFRFKCLDTMMEIIWRILFVVDT